MVEEALIYVHTELQQGPSFKSKNLLSFIDRAYKLVEHLLFACVEGAAVFCENMRKIIERIQKLTRKKENPLLKPFTDTKTEVAGDHLENFYSLSALNEL